MVFGVRRRLVPLGVIHLILLLRVVYDDYVAVCLAEEVRQVFLDRIPFRRRLDLSVTVLVEKRVKFLHAETRRFFRPHLLAPLDKG